MDEKQIDLLWEQYVKDNPSDYETLKGSRIFRALINSLDLELERIKREMLTSVVETEPDVRRFNHDQGALKAVSTILAKLTKPIPEEEEIPSGLDDPVSPAFD